MKTQKTKELGKNNYKLLGAAVAVFIAAIPLAIYDIKAGAGALMVAIVLFLLAMLRPAKQEQAAKSAAPAASAAPVILARDIVNSSPYDVQRFPVVGVTFTNGNTKRQDILRHAYFNDNPFKQGYGVMIRVYEYEGQDAIGVYLSHEGRDGLTYAEQIGNIPAESVPGVIERLDRFDRVTNIDIFGGYGKNWGAAVFLRFWKEDVEHEPSVLSYDNVVFGREKRRSSAEVKNDLSEM